MNFKWKQCHAILLFLPQIQESKRINQEMHWQLLTLFAVQDMCKNLHYICDLSSLINYNKET